MVAERKRERHENNGGKLICFFFANIVCKPFKQFNADKTMQALLFDVKQTSKKIACNMF